MNSYILVAVVLHQTQSLAQKKHTSIIDWILSVINSIKQWFKQNILAR